MSDPYVEDFFAVNRWLLRCAGLWKPESKNKTIQVLFTLCTAGLFLFNVFFTITELFGLVSIYDNQHDLIKSLSVIFTRVLGAAKVVFFHFQGDNLMNLMATLQSTNLRYESSSTGKFFPGLISRKYKKVGIKYTMFYHVLGQGVCINAYITPVVALLFGKGNREKWVPKKLPYHSWMPFKYDTIATYVMAMGYQAFAIFSYAYSIVGMDSLFMNIMNCIGMHLEIIQGAFASLRERSVEKCMGPSVTTDGLHNSQELKMILDQEMKRVCRHLQFIYKVCDDLENIHTLLNLAQTLTTLFLFCLCLFLVSTTPASNKQFWTELIYMMAICFQLVLYCWFGNEITLKADEIPMYIWQCDWITADSEFKIAMLLTMARANRPLHLTAGKFVPLKLDTFISIIKASYSFYAVLNTSEYYKGS